MPLDPIIANPAQVKLNDPLEVYNNYLLADTRMAGLRKEKRDEDIRNALVEGIRQNTDDKGNTNWAGVRSYAAQNRIGDAIPGILKDEGERTKTTEEANKLRAETTLKGAETGLKQAETAHEATKQQKTLGEAFEKAQANYKQQLSQISTDPKVGIEQLVHWSLGQFKDPVMGPVLLKQGLTPESMIAELKETLKTTPLHTLILRLSAGNEVASEQEVTTTNLQDRVVTRYTPKHTLVPQAERTEKMGSNPDAGKNATRVTVNVPVSTQIATHAGKTFGEVIEEADGNDFVALSRLNTNAPAEIASVDQALRMLDSGKVYSGAFAEQKAALASMAKSLGMNVDTTTLANTQLMRQKIANNLMGRLAALKAQGVSLTPMSNLDLENLKAGGPQITDDPATLKEMFRNYRQSITQGIQRYEEIKAKKSGSPYVGETVKKIYQPGAAANVPPAPGKGPITPPPAAIAKLKANPHTAAAFEKTFRLPPGSAQQYLKGGR